MHYSEFKNYTFTHLSPILVCFFLIQILQKLVVYTCHNLSQSGKILQLKPCGDSNGHLLLMSKWIMHNGIHLDRGFICIYISIFSFLNGKCKCAILWRVRVWEPSCWINVTLGYPHGPWHINHRDTFTTLLIRQGPRCTPSNIPSHPSRTPSLSLGQSQGIGEDGGGGRARGRDGEGGVCEVRPPHSEALPWDNGRHKTLIRTEHSSPLGATKDTS